MSTAQYPRHDQRVCDCGQVALADRADAQRAAHAVNARDRTRHHAVPTRCPFGSHHITHDSRAVRARREAGRRRGGRR